MNGQIHIFDRKRVRQHRDRAAPRFSAHHNALVRVVAENMLERIADVKKEFATILDFGAHDGALAGALAKNEKSFVVAADLSEKMLRTSMHEICAVADEEFLPFAAESFDLIVSNTSLHWTNDLPGALAQIRNALRKDGLFLAALIGGQSLYELRSCLMEAELALNGGASLRLSPSIDMQTASGLLQRAGFQLPVTDHEIFTLTYSDIFALMRDLRGMGEANSLAQQAHTFTRRELFEMADQIYKQRFAVEGGRIAATFEVIFMHGWK